MDRYGYDTYNNNCYCIIDKKKNEHIATVFHVTDADRIVMLLNLDGKAKGLRQGRARVQSEELRVALESILRDQ